MILEHFLDSLKSNIQSETVTNVWNPFSYNQFGIKIFFDWSVTWIFSISFYCFLFSSLLFLPLSIFFYLISLLIYYLMSTFSESHSFPHFLIYINFRFSFSSFSLYIYSICYFVRSKVFLFFSLYLFHSLFISSYFKYMPSPFLSFD